jgi:hypothetical protein
MSVDKSCSYETLLVFAKEEHDLSTGRGARLEIPGGALGWADRFD